MTSHGRMPAAPCKDAEPPGASAGSPLAAHEGTQRARIVAALPVLATLLLFGLTVAAFYPGYLSFDSAYHYWQARHRTYGNLSPPAMALAWTAIDAVWRGSGGMFVLQAALYWAGIGLFAQVAFRSAAARTAGALVAGVASPALPIVAHLWTDAALIALLTCASALLFYAIARHRRAALWLALPLLLVAGLVRLNALPATIPLLLLWAHAHATVGRVAAAATARRVVALALALVALTVGAERMIDRLVVTDRFSVPALIMLFDLAGMSVASGETLVPPYASVTGSITLEQFAARYSPLTNVPLHEGPNALRHAGFTRDEIDDVRRRWLGAIAAHPRAYVRHRAAVTAKLFGPYGSDRPASLAFVPDVVPYRDNPTIVPNRSWLNAAVMAAYRSLAATWLGAPASYALVAVVALFAAWPRRRESAGRVSIALAASALAYASPLAFIAPSAELRYAGWLLMSGVLAAVACIASRGPRHEDVPAVRGRSA